MKVLQDEVVAVKTILQESCNQCCQGAVCISYFKRLKGVISVENEKQLNDIFDNIIQSSIKNIAKKVTDDPWLPYVLDRKFPIESKTIQLAKTLTSTIIENMSNKKKITFANISQAIPKWLSKNDQDLLLGSVIQFLFYLDKYTEDEL